MSAPHAKHWDEVPPAVQQQVRFIYGALLDAAIQEDADRTGKSGRDRYEQSSRLFQWDYLPDRMKTAMANMVMAQRHELVRSITNVVQELLVDKVRSRVR